MAIKLTKRQLKEISYKEEAYYFTGNVYSYENIVFYLQTAIFAYRKENKNTSQYYKERMLKDVREEYKKQAEELYDKITSYKAATYREVQVAYSAGVYGNSGQLHKFTLYDKYMNILFSFHTFYV